MLFIEALYIKGFLLQQVLFRTRTHNNNNNNNKKENKIKKSRRCWKGTTGANEMRRRKGNEEQE